ncbi:autophagy protein 5 [Ancistrocladus abbreviatus]
MEKGTEAQQLVWEGAIPLQIHLHESEVTTLPPPPPVMILAPRIGYLPLLVPQIQPLFRSALPPGTDTVWFDYKGLPLKWYIPTGVLFDLLCAEPERPWNLTVHFRGYPTNILTPCEDEVAVKWNFINSLKEAAYIINGNCKNIMNMSQSDQLELWCSVLNGNLEVFLRVSSKLKLGAIEDEFTEKLYLSLKKSKSSIGNAESPGLTKTGRIPVRLYIRIVAEEVDDLEDAPEINSWEQISYINRPVDFHKDRCFSLGDMVRSLMPEYSGDKPPNFEEGTEQDVQDMVTPEDASGTDVAEEASTVACKQAASCHLGENDRIKLIRIQGIEPKKEIPFSWVVNNLGNPDFFLHVCVYIKS